MKKIVVVGATGKLGKEVVEGLETDYDIDFRVWVLMFKRPKQ